jgi:hypothetical protein
MTNEDHAEDAVTEVSRHVMSSEGPGTVDLTDPNGDAIRNWIAMTARQTDAVGTYLLPWGAHLELTAPIGPFAPELHLTWPGQQPVKLLPVGGDRWRIPSLAGTDILLEDANLVRIIQYGRTTEAPRIE